MSANLNVKSTGNDAVEMIARIVTGLTGVQLNDARHRGMIESRLGKRLTELKLNDLHEYITYFKENRQTETPILISLLTTHHTYFFREFSHFEYLSNKVLPALIPEIRKRADKTIRVWSAASSRGQEVYSLSMYLKHHLSLMAPDLKYEILGTDIDPDSVEIAKNGVYLHNEIKEIPMAYLGENWAKGSGDISDYVKAKASIRSQINFSTLNLFEFKNYPKEKFDIIFCRNVFIYFTSEQIKEIVGQLLLRLNPSGYFFIGVSESLNGLGVPVQFAGASVYTHKNHVSAEVIPLQTQKNTITKVLCVDDSATIHTILKQILKKEEGFEIVGIAKNGIEAHDLVQKLKPDVLTLDIHMPEMDGIEYLKKHFNSSHPPVVMVSSVSRESVDLAIKAIQLGASDYVEKPALADMKERGEEICTKLRCALNTKKSSASYTSSIDNEFKKKFIISNPEDVLRVVVMNLSDRNKLKTLFNEFNSSNEPPTVVVLDGISTGIDELKKEFSKICNKNFEYRTEVNLKLNKNQIIITDAKKGFESLKNTYLNKKTSFMVFGELSKKTTDEIKSWKSAHIILEDMGNNKGCKNLNTSAQYIVPVTSFAYHSLEYLCKK